MIDETILLKDAAIMEDDLPRDGGIIPEYAATMVVIFTSYENRVPCGSIRSFCYSEAIEFCGLDQLLLTMESIMDSLNYPQPFLKRRTLNPSGKGKKDAAPFIEMDESARIRTFKDLGKYELRGRHKCFIRVYSRQHGSVQGDLRAGKRDVAFRSGLELMSLLHEYLQCSFADRLESTV